MKKFKEFKKEVAEKIEEKKEENAMKEKKPIAKWLKGTLIGAGAAGVAIGAYVLGKHNGKVTSTSEEDTEDFEETEIYDEDIESEEN